VTLWLPSWLFKFIWIFNWHDSSYWCVSIGLPLYIIYMAYNSYVAFDYSWHDLTWHYWHGLAFWGGNVKSMLLLSDRYVLVCAFSSPSHSLGVQGLEWSLVLRGSCMHVFPLLVLENLLFPSSDKWVYRHDSLLLFLLHHVTITWECTCSCNSLMMGWHQSENSLL